jgi:hypothetical protein
MAADKDFRISADDLRLLEELGSELARLRERRDVLQGLIESKSARRWRTVNVVVTTALLAGSLFGAAITPWTLLVTPVGVVRWINTIKKDSAQENAQVHLRQELGKLRRDVADTEVRYAELKKRIAGPRGSNS